MSIFTLVRTFICVIYHHHVMSLCILYNFIKTDMSVTELGKPQNIAIFSVYCHYRVWWILIQEIRNERKTQSPIRKKLTRFSWGEGRNCLVFFLYIFRKLRKVKCREGIERASFAASLGEGRIFATFPGRSSVDSRHHLVFKLLSVWNIYFQFLIKIWGIFTLTIRVSTVQFMSFGIWVFFSSGHSRQCILNPGEYVHPPKEKTHSVRDMSRFWVNFHLLAAIPNKDWIKKILFLENVDKVEKEFKFEKKNSHSP